MSDRHSVSLHIRRAIDHRRHHGRPVPVEACGRHCGLEHFISKLPNRPRVQPPARGRGTSTGCSLRSVSAYGAGPLFVVVCKYIIVRGRRPHGLGKSAITCWRWRWKPLAPVTPRRHRTRIYILLYTGLRLAEVPVRNTPAITRPPAILCSSCALPLHAAAVRREQGRF